MALTVLATTPPVIGGVEILAFIVVLGFVALCVLSMTHIVPDNIGGLACYVWAWLAFALGIVVLVT